MADTYTKIADLIDPEVMGDMVSARIPKKLRVAPFAKVDDTLAGVPGDTITVPAYAYIGDADIVAEGEAVTIEKMTTSTRKATVKKAMKGIGLTDEAVLSGYGNPVGEANTQLAMAIAAKIDNDCMDVLQTATLTYDGSAGIISYAGVVDAGNVLDNSQPQTGAAGGLAPALIHPVEAFEHAGLRIFRDADAVILDGQGTMAVPGAGGDELDLAAGSIVADGVVAQVLAQLIQLIPVAKYSGALAQIGQGDEGALRVQFLTFHTILGHVQQIDRFHVGLCMGLADAVQMRQLQDVVHQLDHPAGFYMDLPAKLGHIGGFGNAGLNEFRIAGNTGQRRFQLVADVGREILPHLLVVFPQ